MPNPSCSRPSHRLRHSMAKTSAAPTRRGRSASDTAAEQADRGAVLGDPAGQAVGVPAPTGDGHGQIGHVGPQPDGGVDEHVHPLAGHQPADADHQRPVGREAEVGPGRGPLVAAESGRNRSRSTPGGISTTGGMPAPAQGPAASAAG